MNLLIGVLGQNYELYQDQVQALFVRDRTYVILEIKYMRHLFRCLRDIACCRRTRECDSDQAPDERSLYVYRTMQPHLIQERSIRKSIQSRLDNLETRLDAKIDVLNEKIDTLLQNSAS